MSNKYIQIPESISFNCIADKNFTLSSSQYMDLVMPNDNYLLVRDFLSRNLKRSDLGNEVGSINYIKKSPYYFLRTRALQSHSFLPNITSAVPVMPKVFINQNLKEGDVLISKDSNIGEIVILDKDYKNFMTSSAIYKLPIKKDKYYLLACIKHKLFREQLDFIVPKGATIRHAKTDFLDCKIPIPKKNTENIIKYVSVLTEAVISKEKLIKQRYKSILKIIDKELEQGQKSNNYSFEYPSFSEINNISRLDTGLYQNSYKEYMFKSSNYKNSSKTIFELGFNLSRGQNLQKSTIGSSVYDENFHEGFYTLILPTNVSVYGTPEKLIYLGNKKELKTLNLGEIIFGAEGTFRSLVICNAKEKYITNIHGITLYNINLTLSIFIKCMLDYIVESGVIDCIKVGGHGGSFAQKYWDLLQFPIFPETKQKEIAKLYHNPNVKSKTSSANLETFLHIDSLFNKEAGIYELDESAKQLKERLNKVIDLIANNKDVEITFN